MSPIQASAPISDDVRRFLYRCNLNNEKSIENLTYVFYRIVWWCPNCHGDYTATIKNPGIGDDVCLYCVNVKVLPGFNSFTDNHPDLMTQWDKVADIFLVSAKQILDSCAINVWWICEDNSLHHYQLSPKETGSCLVPD